MSTATSMIRAEEATAVQSQMSAKRRKMSTAKEGNVGFMDTAGISSGHTLVAAIRDIDHSVTAKGSP